MVRLWPKGAVFLSLTMGKVLLVAHVVVFYPLKSFWVLFSYWDNGEPNSYGGHDEDCVEMKGSKKPKNAWNDADCQTRNFWVCEKMVTLWLLAKLNFTSTDESLWENVQIVTFPVLASWETSFLCHVLAPSPTFLFYFCFFKLFEWCRRVKAAPIKTKINWNIILWEMSHVLDWLYNQQCYYLSTCFADILFFPSTQKLSLPPFRCGL